MTEIPRRSLDELSKDLKESFTIDDYLEFRRRFPDEESDIWLLYSRDSRPISFGSEYALRLDNEFQKHGISNIDYMNMLAGRADAIDRLCLSILAALAKREQVESSQPHAVGRDLAIGDALVRFLIAAVLESLSFHKLTAPQSFQVLLNYQLNVFDSTIVKSRSERERASKVASFIGRNSHLSMRQVAKKIGIDVSTVSRFMKRKPIKWEVERVRENRIK